MTTRLLTGDCREVLKTLPDESVDCCVTSPPYFGLRDYGMAGQMGLEATPDAFVAQLVSVFGEVLRVLKPTGTLWLNLGDSYSGGKTGRDDTGPEDLRRRAKLYGTGTGVGTIAKAGKMRPVPDGLKPKDLCGIPWRVAFALQADGWYLRQDIIWSKPNPMPESITDRCTKAHEYIFLLAKSRRYYFDAAAIAEAGAGRETFSQYHKPRPGVDSNGGNQGNGIGNPDIATTRNKRSVWEVATQAFSEAHFATFPPALIEPCILAGCPEKVCAKCGAPWLRDVEKSRTFESGSGRAGNMPVGKNGAKLQGGGETMDIRRGPVVHTVTLGFSPSCSCNAETVPGVVLDPFGGAGTTGLVADRLGRNAILIELNPDYAAIGKRRIVDDAPLFAEVAAE